MVKVSIIIPVYNAEKYLRECLDSIVNQTLKDIEVICMNDGSTDNSLEILEEYEEKDERFKVFSQENQGQGVARNNAFKHATGKYFVFVDADDFLDFKTLETCYNTCEEKFLDMVMFQLINYDDDKGTYYTTPLYDMYNVARAIENRVFNYKDLGDLIFNLSVTPVNKMYNTRFVREAGVEFPEGTIFEDNIFSWKLVFNARRMFFIEEYYYKRRVHSNSTLGSGSKKWVDAIDIYNGVWDIFKEHDEFENHKRRLYNNKIQFALFRLDNIRPQFKELFFQAWKEDLIQIQEEYSDYYNLLYMEYKEIFRIVLAAENYEDFAILRNISDINVKIREIESQNNKINNDFNQLSKEYEALVYQNQQLVSENNSIKEENSRLINESNSIKEENSRLINESNSIKEQNTNLVSEIDSVKNEKNQISSEFNSIKEQNNKLSSDYNSIKDNYNKFSLENKQLLDAKNNLLKEKDNYQKEIDRLQNENEHLKTFREDVFTSTSWKITEPLRKITSKFKSN